MTPQDAIDQVEAAFKDVPLPSKEALTNHHCCECLETSQAFGAKSWQEVSLADLLSGRETALLTVAAWRYYLPSVMIWCVREPRAVDVILDNLVFQLTPPDPQVEWARQWFEPRTSGFQREQRRAIASFLEWYGDRARAAWEALGATPPDDGGRALEFWNQ